MVKATSTDAGSIGWSKTNCTGASSGCSSPRAGVIWMTCGGSGAGGVGVGVGGAGEGPTWHAERSVLRMIRTEVSEPASRRINESLEWCCLLSLIYVPP